MEATEKKDNYKMSKKGICELAGVEFKGNGKKHLCMVIYNNRTTETMLEELDKLLKKKENQYDIITGDLNINMLQNSKEKNRSRESLQLLRYQTDSIQTYKNDIT